MRETDRILKEILEWQNYQHYNFELVLQNWKRFLHVY